MGSTPFLVVLWFLLDLLVFQALYSATRLYAVPPVIVQGATGALILSWMITNWEIPHLNSYGLLGFLTGLSLQKLPLVQWEHFFRRGSFELLLLSAGAIVIFTCYGRNLDFAEPFTFVRLFLVSGGAISILLTAWYLSQNAERFTQTVALLAPSLMWIYAAHILFYRVFKAILRLITGRMVELGWIAALLAMLLLYGIYRIMARKFPLLTAILSSAGTVKPLP